MKIYGTEGKEIWAPLKFSCSISLPWWRLKPSCVVFTGSQIPCITMLKITWGACGSSLVLVALTFFSNKLDYLGPAIFVGYMVILVTREQAVSVLRWSSTFQLFW